VAVALTFKGSDQGARATAEGIAKALDQLGVSADKVKFQFQEGRKGVDGLYGSMKDLKREAVQHQRVFGYFGGQIAQLGITSRETGAALVGLGVGLASGMWVMAALEAAKLGRELYHLIATAGELDEATKKALKNATDKTKEWNEETRRAILLRQGLTNKGIDEKDATAAYAKELEKLIVLQRERTELLKEGGLESAAGSVRIAELNEEIGKQKEIVKILNEQKEAASGRRAEEGVGKEGEARKRAQEQEAKDREKARKAAIDEQFRQGQLTEEAMRKEIEEHAQVALIKQKIDDAARKEAADRQAEDDAARVKQSLFELKLESDAWMEEYKKREQASEHFAKAAADDIMAIASGQKSLKDVVREVTASIVRDQLQAVIKSITMSAMDAGGKAAAANAEFPPLAAASMASMIAMVMGLLGSLPSAASGARIPAGVNPIMQLHENERVLTARETRAYEGGGGGAIFNIMTPDAVGVERMLSDSESAFNRWDRRRRRAHRGG
jgi:hypothetical protein